MLAIMAPAYARAASSSATFLPVVGTILQGGFPSRLRVALRVALHVALHGSPKPTERSPFSVHLDAFSNWNFNCLRIRAECGGYGTCGGGGAAPDFSG